MSDDEYTAYDAHEGAPGHARREVADRAHERPHPRTQGGCSACGGESRGLLGRLVRALRGP